MNDERMSRPLVVAVLVFVIAGLHFRSLVIAALCAAVAYLVARVLRIGGKKSL